MQQRREIRDAGGSKVLDEEIGGDGKDVGRELDSGMEEEKK